MRLNEIIDKKLISDTFEDYFSLQGEYEVDDNGYVNTTGHCSLVRPTAKLPVKFNEVGGNFNCSDSNLISLEGAPTKIGLSFYCERNHIPNLRYFPKEIKKSINLNHNQLTDLTGIPTVINGDLDISHNPLQSLDGLPTSIAGILSLTWYKDMPLLKIILIQHLGSVELRPLRTEIDDIELILNKYKGQGQSGALACAAELNKAGFRGNARR